MILIFPRQLAQYRDHRGLNPALDSGIDLRASAIHQTINIMTLGGLALAVGILVDDATVEIENVNRNLEEGKELRQAILDGAQQIAIPALVSLLYLHRFYPMFFLTGWRSFCSFRWPKPWCSPCWRLTFCRVRWSHAGYVSAQAHQHPGQGRTHNPFVLMGGLLSMGFERLRLNYQLLLTTFVYRRGFFVPYLSAFAWQRFFCIHGWARISSPPAIMARFRLHFPRPHGNANRGNGAALRRDRSGHPAIRFPLSISTAS